MSDGLRDFEGTVNGSSVSREGGGGLLLHLDGTYNRTLKEGTVYGYGQVDQQGLDRNQAHNFFRKLTFQRGNISRSVLLAGDVLFYFLRHCQE